jgi:hypothetical protein
MIAAGCGGGGALARDPVASAADRTLDKRSAHFDLTMKFRELPIEPLFTAIGNGAFSDPEQAVELKFDIPQLAGSDAPSTVELRILFPMMYTRDNGMPGPNYEPGKPWTQVNLTKAGVNPLLQINAGNSPTAVLAELRGSKNAKKLGTETVGGIKTTHYRVTLDLERAIARATPAERRSLELLRTAKKQTVQALPVDVWVSADGLVRRVTENLRDTGSVTMTFSRYGAPVKIEAPAPDEIAE